VDESGRNTIFEVDPDVLWRLAVRALLAFAVLERWPLEN